MVFPATPKPPGALQAIQRAAAAKKLDWRPLASVAQYESGLNPRALGDGGHAFGLFQNNNAGGTITGDPNPRRFFNPLTSAQYTANAVSRLGLEGLTPEQQIHAIVYRYERPADPAKEYAAALTNYRTRYAGAQPAMQAGTTSSDQAPSALPAAPSLPTLSAAFLAPLQQGFDLGQQQSQRALDALGKISKRSVLAPQAPNLASLLPLQAAQAAAPTLTQAAPTAKPAKTTKGIAQGRGGFVLPLPSSDHWTPLGSVSAHKARPLGNWESDNAIDLGTKVGTPVYAVADGTIGSQIGSLNSSQPRLAGERLHLVTKGNEFYYAHLSKLAVKAGQRVTKGQLIGYSGSANGAAHLHIASKYGDPQTYFNY